MSSNLVDWTVILLIVVAVTATTYIIWLRLRKKFGHMPSRQVEFFNTEGNQQFTGTDGYSGAEMRQVLQRDEAVYPARRRQDFSFQLGGGATLYGYNVITPEVMGRYGLYVFAERNDDPDDVILEMRGIGGAERFRARRINSTTLSLQGRVSSIDQVQTLLADADESQRAPQRKRTVIWESGDDTRA